MDSLVVKVTQRMRRTSRTTRGRPAQRSHRNGEGQDNVVVDPGDSITLAHLGNPHHTATNTITCAFIFARLLISAILSVSEQVQIRKQRTSGHVASGGSVANDQAAFLRISRHGPPSLQGNPSSTLPLPWLSANLPQYVAHSKWTAVSSAFSVPLPNVNVFQS